MSQAPATAALPLPSGARALPRLRDAHLCAALLALTVVAYLPMVRNDFIDFDDEDYITANPHVREGLTGPGFVWAWTTLHGKYWQPLSWLSLELDARLFSGRSADGQPVLWPAGFHAESLLWHAASAVLLFLLLRRLTGFVGRSFLVAGLFAVHPLHVESVAWAAERKDVLSVFLGIVTLWAYVRYVERPGWRHYLGVAAAFALSLLCKPMLMTLPFVLLLLDYWPLRRTGEPYQPDVPARGQKNPSLALRAGIRALGRVVPEKLPLFALAAAVGVVTVLAREHSGAPVSWEQLPLSARLANAATAYGWYVAATFCPTNLAVLYPHPLRNWSAPAALAGLALLGGVTLLAAWQARRRPWLLVGWLWFVGTLVPVIGLAQGGEQAWADRFSYWPHVGLFVAVAWGLGELAGRLRLPAAACAAAGALALAALAGLTAVQVTYWRDTVTVWEHALAVRPDNARAHANLGNHYQAHGRPDAAAAHLAEAVRLSPDSADFASLLGVSLLQLGRDGEAAEAFHAAVARKPREVTLWYDLALARLRQGRPDLAEHSFRKVLDLQPPTGDALAGLGLALGRQGRRP